MSFQKLLIAIILIVAGIAIVLVVVPAMGVTIPAAFERIFWICLLAAAGIVAILFLFKWWSSVP